MATSNTMTSGSTDHDIYTRFIEMVSDADIKTLRKIAIYTSNQINALSSQQKVTLDKSELDNHFTHIPNFLPSETPDTRKLRSSQNNQNNNGNLLDRVMMEVESLGLEKGRRRFHNLEKVKTQWLLDDNIQLVHSDFKNSDNMSNFPAICQLRDKINQYPDCKGAVNSCIVNCYQPKASRTRPHSDDEIYINQNVSICTLSLGETRDFNIYTKSHKNQELLSTYTLESGSVFMMHPGSQATTKHRVMPSSSASSIRYSISFRGIIPSYNASGDDDEVDSPKTDTTLIFGTSISKRLDSRKLAGKSGKTVLNLSVGGSKIRDIEKHMDEFYSQNHEYFKSDDAMSLEKMNITNIIICTGTNDVLNSSASSYRFYIPLQNLLRKAKVLFSCKVHLQSMIPIPGQFPYMAKQVYAFNEIAVKACRAERCYYINVFSEFLNCRSFRKFYHIKPNNVVDIHPNKIGESILARAYIPIVRDYFNPYGNN